MAGRRRWAATLAVTLCALVACSGAGPKSVGEAVTAEPTPTPTPTAEPTEPVATWPLTGLPMEEGESRPAVAVKIENTAMARPQTGLDEADVVWEEMVEGGITRFNAIFHSRLPEVVGPIRSLRPMDAGIVGSLGGPQVISGGQQLFLSSVREAGIQLISHDAGDAGFFRSSDRRAPHNLYGRTADFLAQAGAADPPPEQFAFAAEADGATAVRAGEPATAVRLRFPQTSPGWTWDPEGGRWERDEAGSAATTPEGAVLGAQNVVVLRVQVVASAGRDQSGNAVPETVMTGTGEALVASAGHTVAATWSKPDVGDPVTLTAADGTDVELAPGSTWVELVPVDRGGVDVER